jgi:hypothetical protein
MQLTQLTPRGGGGGLFTLGVATPMTSSDAGRRPRQTRSTTTTAANNNIFTEIFQSLETTS